MTNACFAVNIERIKVAKSAHLGSCLSRLMAACIYDTVQETLILEETMQKEENQFGGKGFSRI